MASRVTWHFDRPAAVRASREVLKDHVMFTQIMFVRIIKKILSNPGSGKQYSKMPARSSKPGESPVAQTGTLRASWGILGPVSDQPDMIDANIWQRGILAPGGGSPLKYGFYLEEGTTHMKKRPHVKTAVEETQSWSDRNLDRVAREMTERFNNLEFFTVQVHNPPTIGPIIGGGQRRRRT